MILKRCILILFLIVLLAFSLSAATDTLGGNACLYYFYGKDCQGCTQVDQFMEGMQSKYPQLHVERYEVYYDVDNLHLLNQYFDAYGVPPEGQHVPVIFSASTFFVGSNSIISVLEQHLGSNPNPACPSLNRNPVVGLIGAGAPSNVLHTLTFTALTGGALGHAFSRAGLALIALLFLFIIAPYDQIYIRKKGFLFLVGVYVVYLLFALGFFSAFMLPTPGWLFYKIVGIVSIILALPALKNFVSSKPIFFKNVSEKTKKSWEKLHLFRWLLAAPSLIFWGIITSVFTLSYPSKTIIVLRTLFAENIGRMAVVPMMFYYVLIFVLPFILLTILLQVANTRLQDYSELRGGLNRPEVEQWKKHVVKVLNLMVGVLLIVVGIGMLN